MSDDALLTAQRRIQQLEDELAQRATPFRRAPLWLSALACVGALALLAVVVGLGVLVVLAPSTSLSESVDSPSPPMAPTSPAASQVNRATE